jgi:hypothetical protein
MRCDFALHYGAVVEERKRENIVNSRTLDATEMFPKLFCELAGPSFAE